MPQPPAPADGKKKAGLVIGAVAVVVALGVGAYFVFAGGGSGPADDGPHKLATPATVLSDYKRISDDGAGAGESDDSVKELEESGIENGTSVIGMYSTADLSNYDPSDPSTLPDGIETAKGVTFLGGYGEIADPAAALDKFFATLKKQSESGSGGSSQTKSELVGEPVEADLDGAVMKCQAAQGQDLVTKKEKTDWFCVWADYSTMAMVTPGDRTQDVTKDVAVDITTKLRDEIRVAK
jgi:hypothetical protein